jgi:cysteine desulfurase
VVVRALSALGIYVSSQSACSTRRGDTSRILQAIGLSERDARTGIRVSYDADLQEQQIDLFFEKLTDVLRDISRIQRA